MDQPEKSATRSVAQPAVVPSGPPSIDSVPGRCPRIPDHFSVWSNPGLTDTLALLHAALLETSTSAAYSRSNALTAPLRQLSAMDADMGSGKMSSSPLSTPSRMARATDSGEAFGMSRPRDISVSTGPVRTACTLTPGPAKRARSDCVRENVAAFEIEYAGMTGKAAKAATDRTLTIAPRERVSSGRKAWVTPYVPKRLTSRCRSSAARSLKSSYSAKPALLMRISRDPTLSTAP